MKYVIIDETQSIPDVVWAVTANWTARRIMSMNLEQAERLIDTALAAASATQALFEVRQARQRGEATEQDVIGVAHDYLEKFKEFENSRNTLGVL